MHYTVIEYANKKIVEVISSDPPLRTEQDAVDVIAANFEHDTTLLLLHYHALDADFFQLRTRVAGSMIQKWINYHLKTAAIIPQDLVNQGRFQEMVLEMNKRNSQFRVFNSREDATNWLAS